MRKLILLAALDDEVVTMLAKVMFWFCVGWFLGSWIFGSLLFFARGDSWMGWHMMPAVFAESLMPVACGAFWLSRGKSKP